MAVAGGEDMLLEKYNNANKVEQPTSEDSDEEQAPLIKTKIGKKKKKDVAHQSEKESLKE